MNNDQILTAATKMEAAALASGETLEEALRSTCLRLAATKAALLELMEYCEPTFGQRGKYQGCAVPSWLWDKCKEQTT